MTAYSWREVRDAMETAQVTVRLADGSQVAIGFPALPRSWMEGDDYLVVAAIHVGAKIKWELPGDEKLPGDDPYPQI